MAKHTELLQDETLSQKLITKGFWLYFFSFLVGPAGYLIRLIVSNSSGVSVADVGILYSIISLISFLNIYNDLGLTESLQYFLPRYWIKKEYNNIKTSIALSFSAQFISAILIALILRIGADRLALHYFQAPESAQILKYFCIYFLGINFFQTLQSIFIAFQKTFDYQFVSFVQMSSILAFTAFFFFTGRQSITRYSLSRVMGLGVGILVARLLYSKKYRSALMQGKLEYNKSALKTYLNYALCAFLGLNVGIVFGQLTQQLVIFRLGAEAAGYYTNFTSLINITSILIGPIIGLIFPMVSELVSKKDIKKLNLLFQFFYTYFSVFSFSLALFLMVLGPEIAVILFGEKFLFSGKLLTIGGLVSIIIILTNFNFSLLAGMGKVKERGKIMGIGTLVLAIVSWLAIERTGIYGAVIGFIFAYLALFLLSIGHLRKEPFFSWKLNRYFIIKNSIILLILSAFLFVCKGEIFVLDSSERWLNFGKLIGIGLLFYRVLVGCNYKNLKLIKDEIKKIKKQHL